VAYNQASQYSIGITPTDLLALRDMHIAPPDQVVYRPASIYYVRGDMSRVGDGFAMCEWIWDAISLSRLSTILEFLDGDTYKDVYIVTDKRDGTFSNPDDSFALFYAKMWKPILSGEEGVSIARSPYALQTVKIQFVDLVEQSGYL